MPEELSKKYFSEKEYEEMIKELPNEENHFLIGIKLYNKVSEELELNKEDKEKYKKDSINIIAVDSEILAVSKFMEGEFLINTLFLQMKTNVIYKIRDGKY
jgi:hypothetical protein